MRSVLLSALVAAVMMVASVLPARAEIAEADASTIRTIISEQLQAFQRDDGERAFSYASPSIQAQFRNPEFFMKMVSTGYPAVYRPKVVEFMELTETPRGPQQDVFVVGPDGSPVIARYYMEMQADGTWKIDGCSLLKSEDIAA